MDELTKLRAEYEEVCSVTMALRDKYEWLEEQNNKLKELIGGASLHPETGVSVYDDVKDLMAEVAKLKEDKRVLIGALLKILHEHHPVGLDCEITYIAKQALKKEEVTQ